MAVSDVSEIVGKHIKSKAALKENLPENSESN
jgi:hypothetical protein